MSGPLFFPLADVPGWRWVGELGDWVLTKPQPGMERQSLQVFWVAVWTILAFLVLRALLRQVPRLNRPLAWTGNRICHLFERMLMWIDYRLVTAFRTVGLTPFYWPSEAIERAAALGDLLITRAARSATAFAGRRAGWIALALALACLVSWDYSVCVPGAGPGCVPPHLGWWRYTSRL